MKKRQKISLPRHKKQHGKILCSFCRVWKIKNKEPGSKEVQLLVKNLQDYISEHFYQCSNEILNGLGKMYASGAEFTENIDKAAGAGTAAFVAEAIEIYTAR